MREDKNSSGTGGAAKISIRNYKGVLINIVLVFILICNIGLLVLFNQKLKNSVQNERIEAVNQIGYLLIDRITQLKDSYTVQVESMVNVLFQNNQEVNDNLNDYFLKPEDWLMIDEEGNFFTINGENAVLAKNSQMMSRLLQESGTFSSFISIQGRGDFWAFTHKLDYAEISGRTIIGLSCLVSAKTFSDIATVSLYDHKGGSYIVDQDGVIVMHPEDIITDNLFKGYNVYASLKSAGVAEQEYADLRKAISSYEEYEDTYNANNISWLVQAIPTSDEYELIVTVPISLTAEATYSGLSYLMVSVAFVCLSVAMILFYNQYNLMRKGRNVQVQYAKATAKSDFMNKMSHDIRTPLNAVVGLHELALESIDDKDVVYDCIVKAQISNKYLISLVNDVLDMSRIEAGKMQLSQIRLDLEETVKHVMQMESQVASDAGINFTYEEREKFDTDYLGDPVRIRQCLMNLVSNAIKFTPKNGNILLSIGHSPLDDKTDQISMVVEDTGVGMSEEYMEHIFTPFEQEKNSMTNTEVSGSGLGLSIVSSLVKLMDGTISVKSTKNVGSRFEILLPLSKLQKEEQREQVQDAPEEFLMEELRGKHILLVEDHPVNRQIITKLLENMGLVVDTAENGLIGVSLFHSSEVNYYSFILMDIKMPIMGGLEAAKAIRRLKRVDAETITIIALSANAFEEDMKASIEAGMQMHLAKPIDMVELKKTLAKFMKRGNKR